MTTTYTPPPVLPIKANYTYGESALIVGVSRHTISKWVSHDLQRPPEDQRLPGALNGKVPLKAICHHLGMTVDELRQLDIFGA